MNINIYTDYDELSEKAAQKAAEYIRSNPGTLVCFAAGETPLGMFKELISMQNRGDVDLSSVFYAGLDEWVGLEPGETGTCYEVMTNAYYGPAGIPKEKLSIFNGVADDMEQECLRMENWISSHGGIGFTVLGIGLNGHIGFNEPGAPDREGCFTIPLDEVTIAVSSKYFAKVQPVNAGVTIGWRTLLKAGTAIIMVNGEAKAPVVKEAFEGPVTIGMPASVFQQHNDFTLMLDKGAASLLK